MTGTRIKNRSIVTIFLYDIVLQTEEVHPEDGVPLGTEQWTEEFFEPQTDKSLAARYDGWIKRLGYHLVSYSLRGIKAKFPGDIQYRTVWGLGDEISEF